MKHVQKLIFITLLICCSVGTTFSQNESDLSNFLQANGEDASELVEGYIKPVITSVSYAMTGGWYNTAKPHKSLGFDFGVSLTLAFVPTSENYFNPQSFLSPGTSFANIDAPGKGAPSIFGPKDLTTYSTTYDPDGNGSATPQTFTFNGPEGFDMKKTIGFAAMPVPMAQVGIGIIKGTDIKFRMVPEITFENSKVKMIGFGVLHDVKQHIPGVKNLPFDLSALVAYNSVTAYTNLENSDSNDARPDSPDGAFDSKFNSWVIQGIISKKISVLTGYVGLGYSIVKTKAHVNGTYTIVSDGGFNFDITDPVSIDFKNNSTRLTAGLRLKFGPFYMAGDYTIQKYNAFTFSTGFSVR